MSTKPPKKLGLLLSAAPGSVNFLHATRLAEVALQKGMRVYLYCVDAAVEGIHLEDLQSLKTKGLNLFACAQSAQSRDIPPDDTAAFSGLTILSDIMADTDRFVSFT